MTKHHVTMVIQESDGKVKGHEGTFVGETPIEALEKFIHESATSEKIGPQMATAKSVHIHVHVEEGHPTTSTAT